MAKIKKKNIFIVSDATGDTASHVLNAAMRQFPKNIIKVSYFRKVSDPEQIKKIVETAERKKALLVYTFVYEKNRQFISELSRKKNVLSVDVLGNAIDAIAEHLGVSPGVETTLGKRITDDYLRRIEALDFFLSHDDGVRYEDAIYADVVLIGVSRSGKSPLSLYLAQKGYKVINIPYVKDVPMPDSIFQIERLKIIGLIIRPERLYEIRKKRLQQYQYHETNYADIDHIHEELEDLRRFFRKNKIKKVIDITHKAIEEAAAEITEYLELLEIQNEENSEIAVTKIDSSIN